MRELDSVPPGASEARAIILLIHRPGSPPLNRAFARSPASLHESLTLTSDLGAQIFALYYQQRSLEELGIADGELVLHDPGEANTRPLPPYDAAAAAELTDRELHWRTLAPGEALPNELASRAIAALDIAACVSRGGCLEGQEAADERARYCTLPCPDPGDFEPPEPPRFTPCPEEWFARSTRSGTKYCDPPEIPPAAQCAPFEAQFFPKVECERIGTSCAADGWPTDLPPDRPILYVRAGAPPGGNGTRDLPFREISPALLAAAPGTVLALARGTYEGSIHPPAGVELHGACAEDTTLAITTAEPDSLVVLVDRPGIALRNLRIAARGLGVRAVGAAAELELENVLIDRPGDEALQILDHASGTVRRTRILQAETIGVRVNQGSRASFEDLAIDSATTFAIGVSDPGTAVRFDGLSVRDTRLSPDQTQGMGLLADNLATATVAHALLDGNHAAGVYAKDGARAHIEDVIISGTLPTGAGHGTGLHLVSATATVARAALIANDLVALDARSSTVTIEDLAVRGTRAGSTPRLHYGLFAWAGSDVRLARVSLLESAAMPLFVALPNTFVDASDLLISGGALNGEIGNPTGIYEADDARLLLSRAVIEDFPGPGVAVVGQELDHAQATLEDLVVRGANQVGLNTSKEATTHGDRLLFEDNVVGGVQAVGRPTLQLSRMRITGAGLSEPPSFGMELADGSAAVLSSFVIDHSGTGLLVDRMGSEERAASLECSLGLISNNVAGTVIVRPDFPLWRAAKGVRYRDNVADIVVR